jgi:hypothetical protein
MDFKNNSANTDDWATTSPDTTPGSFMSQIAEIVNDPKRTYAPAYHGNSTFESTGTMVVRERLEKLEFTRFGNLISHIVEILEDGQKSDLEDIKDLSSMMDAVNKGVELQSEVLKNERYELIKSLTALQTRQAEIAEGRSKLVRTLKRRRTSSF